MLFYLILLRKARANMTDFKFSAISIFPEIFAALNAGITGQALAKNLYEFSTVNPRHYSDHPRGYIDDRPFGGGPGMVMMAPAIDKSISAAKKLVGEDAAIINLSPHGYPLTQPVISELTALKKLIFICGRYEGIDQRVIDEHVTHHICLADIVISGGEIAALACLDAIIRQIPGALTNPESTRLESFQGPNLDYPHYTKPKIYKKKHVPTVLLSGDHARIELWRKLEAEKMTNKFRIKQENQDKTER